MEKGIIACIAVNNIGFIGKDNKLLWHCSEDLKHFKKLTEGKVMLVGMNTFKTLPRVVCERDIIVDKRENDPDWIYDKPIELNQEQGKQVICIGGKKTYEKYCHLFTELHVSHINDNSIGDCTFSDFRNLPKECKIFNYYFEVNENK